MPIRRHPKGAVIGDEKVGGRFAPDFSAPVYTNSQFHAEVPERIKNLIRRINAHGFEAYVVGGAVRDAISGKEPHDFDITTSATMDELQDAFKGEWRSNAGESHGTILLPDGVGMSEVTSYRVDVETDGRHAVTQHTRDLTEDLQRRDFTMNALAWNPVTNELVGTGKDGDPSQNISDIKSGVIRFVGDGDARVREDALRVLRGIRFVAQNSNRSFAPETEAAIVRGAPVLIEGYRSGLISAERVSGELRKAFGGYKVPSRMIIAMAKTGLLREFLPEVADTIGVMQNKYHGNFDVFDHTMNVLDSISADTPSLENVRWSALFHDTGKTQTQKRVDDDYGYSFIGHENVSDEHAERRMTALKMPREVIDPVRRLVRGHMVIPKPEHGDGSIRRWLRKIGDDNFEDYLRFRRADSGAKPKGASGYYDWEPFEARVRQIANQKPPEKPVVRGDEISRIFGLQGRQIGFVIGRVQEAMDDGIIGNTREDILTYISQIPKDMLPPHGKKG